MAIFEASQITRQGHALLAKVLSGTATLHFSEVWAGDGRYDGDVLDLTDLVSPRLQGSMIRVEPMGLFTELEMLLTNQHLPSAMEFREVGVKAVDPDIGPILFAYTNAGDNFDVIGPFNGVFLTEEQFTMRIYTANIAEISATITPSAFATQIRYDNTRSGLEATNVQDAIDELTRLLHAHIHKSVASPDGVHDLRYYDDVLSAYFDDRWNTIVGKKLDPAAGCFGDSYFDASYFG